MPRPRASAAPAATVADRLHSAAIHLLRALRRRDDASGLSAPRLSALSVVVFGGPITLGALAAAEQVRPPTMTHLVRALEADGLVARRSDADDARVVHVRATAKGRAVLMRGRELRVELLTRQLARCSPGERRTLAEAAAIIERLVPDMR